MIPFGLVLKLVPSEWFEKLKINEEAMTEDEMSGTSLSMIRPSKSLVSQRSITNKEQP